MKRLRSASPSWLRPLPWPSVSSPPQLLGPVSTPTTVSTVGSPLGRILVDGKGRTLYLFENDKRGHSACYGAVRPLLAAATRGWQAGGASRGKDRATRTITRRDGTKQVTYAGHPLYRSGRTRGQARRADRTCTRSVASWYVVSPAGKKIESGRTR